MPTDIATIIGFIAKGFTILALLLYAIFAVVMVRQEQLMAHVLEETFEPVLRLFVYIHLAVAMVLVFIAFILL